jgi:mitochondrial fission protein ELM1
MGDRVGDNSQVLGLGEALGWPLVEKHFIYTPWEKLVNLPFGSHVLGVVKERSSALEAPWPDLVISAGRKNEPIARYIRKQADKRVRLIHVGRPWAKPSTWDLVITTPQYRLPRDPNIVHNETPLHRVTRARLDEAARAWEARVAHLPRPRIAVLAGGNSTLPLRRVGGAGASSSLVASRRLLLSRRARAPSTDTRSALRRHPPSSLPLEERSRQSVLRVPGPRDRSS